MKYYQRLLTQQLLPFLFKGKALIIVGARQVGKTTMLSQWLAHQKDVIWLNADLSQVRDRLSNPSLQILRNIIGHKKVIIIDEIQRISNPGLLLKILVDNFKEIQIIATGSSALEIADHIFEPLTGRYFLFHLFPLLLPEIYPNHSNFEAEQELPFHLVYGSYPEVCTKRDIAEPILTNLAQQYLYKDVLIWKDIRKPELLEKLLKLLAYQIGSEVSILELSKQLNVNSETINNYIDLLEKSFVIFRLKAYSTNPRKEIRKMNKIFFWDNGIRNAVIENFDDLANRQDVGALFENFIISERLKRNTLVKPKSKGYFWRNYNQREVDYIELTQNEIYAYEIKWNAKKKHTISRAFTNLYPKATTQVITPANFWSFLKT